MDQLLETISLFTNVFEITGDQHRHEESLKVESTLHHHEIRVANEQDLKERFLEKQIYLLSVYADIEAYCQELNENLIQNNRDAERDMIDQRNQQLQTVLLAGTIMLSAIVGVLFQAAFPNDYYESTYYLYFLTIALSMTFLVLSMILCIEILFRIYRFTYKRSLASIDHLQKSLQETRDVEAQITGRAHNIHHYNLSSPVDSSRSFSKLSPSQIEREFYTHEEEVEKYFSRRDRLNAEFHSLIGGKKEISFETYWNQRCELFNQWSIICFYLGTLFNVIATAVFMYAYFDIQYLVIHCSYAISTILGLFSIIMVILVYVLQFDPTMQHLYRNIQKFESEIIYTESGRIMAPEFSEEEMMQSEELKQE